MTGINFIIYKESIELKSNFHIILQLAGQSIFFGLVFPIVAWALLNGLIPVEVKGFTKEQIDTEVIKFLKTFYPALIPFFIAQMLATFTLPTISQEIENHTIEHLLALPISWRKIILGKIIFYTLVSIVCSYLIGLTYWLGTYLVIGETGVAYLFSFFIFFLPAISIYVVCIALLISTLTRDTKITNLYSGIFTWGLFLAMSVISWITRFAVNDAFLLIISLVLLLSGTTGVLILFRYNTEKLIT